MDFRRRIDALQARMEQAGLDLVCFASSADLFPLTGIRRPPKHSLDRRRCGQSAHIGRSAGGTASRCWPRA